MSDPIGSPMDVALSVVGPGGYTAGSGSLTVRTGDGAKFTTSLLLAVVSATDPSAFTLFTISAIAGDMLTVSVVAGTTDRNYLSGDAVGTGIVNVRAFGAVGDDSADDTTAVQAAFDAAGLVKGTVIVPPGVYRVDELTVGADVAIRGTNRAACILKLNDGQVNPSTAESLLILAAGAIVEQLTLDGNLANNPGPAEFSTSLVQATDSPGFVVRNCILKNSAHYGVFAYQSPDATICGTEFTNISAYAAWALQACHRIRIADNWFHGSTSSAIKIHATDSSPIHFDLTTEDPTITNNIIDYRGLIMPTPHELAIEIFNPTNRQNLTITAIGGTYTLEVAGGGTSTAAINWNANAAAIEAALNLAGLPSVVSGTNPYTITIAGTFLQVNTGGLVGTNPATIGAVPPTPGVVGAYIAGNRIWGPDGVGTETVFGISCGGCTRPIVQGNHVTGPNIGIGLEAANAIHPLFTSNFVSDVTLGWSVTGQTVAPKFTGNTVQNTTSWGIQLYGNYSGQNQSSVTHALISGNTFIDSGTDNTQFATILLNDAGSFSVISDNMFVIKDSPNPIRALQIFTTTPLRGETIRFSGNLCSPDMTGSASFGYGIAQIDKGYRCEITNNTATTRSATGANGGIDGIDLQGDAGNGHLVTDNIVYSALISFNEATTGGDPCRWFRNDSHVPTGQHYILPAVAIKQDNRISGELAL